MVSQIFQTIGEVISGIITNMTSALEGVTALFWAEPTGSETAGHLTVLGVLSVIAVGAGVVYFMFNLIRSLLQRGAARG